MTTLAALFGWHEFAACRDADGSLFFGPENEGTAAKVRREWKAKRVCGGCLVSAGCREYALDRPETAGVWGAMSEGERDAERRNRRRRVAARGVA